MINVYKIMYEYQNYLIQQLGTEYKPVLSCRVMSVIVIYHGISISKQLSPVINDNHHNRHACYS